MESLNRLHKQQQDVHITTQSGDLLASGFESRDLKTFVSAEDAYHQLIIDLMICKLRPVNWYLKAQM